MIHIVLGTKAQLIKMAPVMARLQRRRLPYNFIFTGQHRATTQEMLEEFGLKRPDVTLYHGDDVVSVGRMAGWMVGILWRTVRDRSRIFQGDRRGVVLVHGDTFSTLLGALMGRFAGLDVGHVESGLRSRRIFHPFPEELTRLATFRLSHTLYCPGAWAMENVRGLRRRKIDIQANTLIDTLNMALGLSRRRDHVPDEPFGLVSLHRYENIFRRRTFERILEQVERIARRRKLLVILHPPTERQLRRFGLDRRIAEGGRIELRPRYTYCDFVALLERAEFIVTDGGSVQEETSYLGVPCLLMRKATERQEGLGGNAVLSDYDPQIVDEFLDHLDRYRGRPDLGSVSPSDIIVDSVTRYA
jgi:UDP-N-acetylglucosamine 2-epimerase (non-hydrolysing)